MLRQSVALTALVLMSACGDGQPLFDENGNPNGSGATDVEGTDGTDTTGSVDGDIITDGALPPGTANPSADASIFRVEERDGVGGGLVTQVSYNKAADTFTVDNLGFDGANVYQPFKKLETIGGSRVFAADDVAEDFLTGDQIDQLRQYRALYGVSTTQLDGEPRTSFAIVRTGGFVDNGFGGYIYERNGGVQLPDSGQATFSGEYAGMRVFEGRSGIEYTDGDMRIDIDFEDFNANDAVKGSISNRRAFDSEGIRLQTGNDEADLKLPPIVFTIQEGSPSLNSDGEITVNVASYLQNENGLSEPFETGTFNGLVAGDTTTGAVGSPGRGGEIVGVVKVTSEDPRAEGVIVQETGGAILTR